MLVYYFVPFIVSNRYLLFWVSNGHNSVTVQNRTHVYMNFFDHKDLGNHLLQLCPKVVKHPVYIHINDLCMTLKPGAPLSMGLQLYTEIYMPACECSQKVYWPNKEFCIPSAWTNTSRSPTSHIGCPRSSQTGRFVSDADAIGTENGLISIYTT